LICLLAVSVLFAHVDIQLGGDDAEPVCDALARRGVPFVFYTGRADAPWRRWAEAPFVVKPARSAVIVGAIKYAISADKQDVLSFSDHPKLITIDQRIADGEERIVRIKGIISRLEATGLDMSVAKALLVTMTTSLALMRDHRRLMASKKWCYRSR